MKSRSWTDIFVLLAILLSMVLMTIRIVSTEKSIEHLESFVGHLDEHQISLEPYVKELEERIKELEESVNNPNPNYDELLNAYNELQQASDYLEQYNVELENKYLELKQKYLDLKASNDEVRPEYYEIAKGTIVALSLGDNGEKIAIFEIPSPNEVDGVHRILLEYTDEDLQVGDEIYLVWFDDNDYIIIEVIK